MTFVEPEFADDEPSPAPEVVDFSKAQDVARFLELHRRIWGRSESATAREALTRVTAGLSSSSNAAAIAAAARLSDAYGAWALANRDLQQATDEVRSLLAQDLPRLRGAVAAHLRDELACSAWTARSRQVEAG